MSLRLFPWGATLTIAGRSLRRNAVAAVATSLATAMAVGLVISVWTLRDATRRSFTGGDLGYDAVLGARGSAVQLVLSAVFQLETSPGNIPWSLYQALKADSRVSAALPIASGDNYLGYPMVGSLPSLFTDFPLLRRRSLTIEPGGRAFDPSRREAVVGAAVARRAGLTLGARFEAYHGLTYDPAAKHPGEFVVTGVLAPTGGPIDRVIWVSLEAIHRMEGHVLRGDGQTEQTAQPDQAIPEELQDLSAVLIKLRDPQSGFSLAHTINKQGKVATLAWPIARTMGDLLDRLGWAERVLTVVGWLTALCAAATIFVGIWVSQEHRTREFAALRVLGAPRWFLLWAVLAQAAVITGVGVVLGLGVFAGLATLAAVVVQRQTGVILALEWLHPAIAVVPIAMFALGLLAGLPAAIRAYRADVLATLERG